MVKATAPLLPPDVTGPLTDRLNAASSLLKSDPEKAAKLLLDIVLDSNTYDDTEQEEPPKVKEAAVYILGELNVEQK